MQSVTVNRLDLLIQLRTNRENHRTIFEEACAGYRAECERQLREQLRKVEEGKVQVFRLALPVPADHTKDYDRVIKMVEMSVTDDIELNQRDFASYVMDDWQWKREFLATNSSYSTTAADFYVAAYGDEG